MDPTTENSSSDEAKDDESIYFFGPDGKWGCFANRSRHSFTIDGTEYPTVEHYFQSKKFEGTPHEDTIIKAKSPADAANLGHSRKFLPREDWNDIRADLMYKGVRAKFEQNPKIMKILLSTAPHELRFGTAKGQVNDVFWGYAKGTGKNKMGKILMHIRDEFLQKGKRMIRFLTSQEGEEKKKKKESKTNSEEEKLIKKKKSNKSDDESDDEDSKKTKKKKKNTTKKGKAKKSKKEESSSPSDSEEEDKKKKQKKKKSKKTEDSDSEEEELKSKKKKKKKTNKKESSDMEKKKKKSKKSGGKEEEADKSTKTSSDKEDEEDSDEKDSIRIYL